LRNISHRRRGGAHHEHLEQFNENSSPVDRGIVGLAPPEPFLIAPAAREPADVDEGLHDTDTRNTRRGGDDVQSIAGLTMGDDTSRNGLADNDRGPAHKIVTVAEEIGKHVFPW